MAEEVSWSEAIGAMSTRQVADTFGVSRSAAWRALTGRTALPKFAGGGRMRNLRAAEAFRRRGGKVRPGRIPVYEKSPRRRTYRTIGAVELADPERIARYLEQGRYGPAEGGEGYNAQDALSAQIVNAYGEPAGIYPDEEGRGGLADELEILDYPEGI
jgi:hypothetical protein